MLSSKARYGLKAMVHLARRQGEGPVLIAAIAAAEHIPRKFLDAILLELKTAGLLASKKGKGGGYHLARPAAAVTAGDVIRSLDGPLAPVSCVSRSAYRPCADCPDEAACAVRRVMQDVRDAIAQVLDNTTLADLAAHKAPPPILMYDI